MTLLTFSAGGWPEVSTKCPRCGKHADTIWHPTAGGDHYDMAHDWQNGTWCDAPPPNLHLWTVPFEEVS